MPQAPSGKQLALCAVDYRNVEPCPIYNSVPGLRFGTLSQIPKVLLLVSVLTSPLLRLYARVTMCCEGLRSLRRLVADPQLLPYAPQLCLFDLNEFPTPRTTFHLMLRRGYPTKSYVRFCSILGVA